MCLWEVMVADDLEHIKHTNGEIFGIVLSINQFSVFRI
jgi:hypothetical protein